MPVRRMDGIGSHHQILIDKLGRIGIVGVDTTDFCGGKDHDFRGMVAKELVCRSLVTKVQFVAGFENQILSTRVDQRSIDSLSNHPSMTGNKNGF